MKPAICFFLLIGFLSCNTAPKKNKPTNNSQKKEIVSINFTNGTKKASQEINLLYVDQFNDRQTMLFNGSNDQRMEIETSEPVFLLDWSANQTYYVVYPGEKINIHPPISEDSELNINILNVDKGRKNELLFFQLLAKHELDGQTEAFSKLLKGSLMNKGRDGSGKAMMVLQLMKNKNLKDPVSSSNFLRKRQEKRMEFLKNYKSKNQISSQFERLATDFFKYEYQSDIFLLMTNALRKNLEINEELKFLAKDAKNSLTANHSINNPAYQSLVKSFLEYGFQKNKIISLKDKFSFITKELSGDGKLFAQFLILKADDYYGAQDSLLYKRIIYQNGFRSYATYINERRNFLADTKNKSPETVLKNINGEETTFNQLLKSYKDQVVVIDFWASWCLPCKAEVPNSKKLVEDLKGKSVVFVYLSLDENINLWKKDIQHLQLLKNSYIVKNAFNSNLAKFLEIKSIPRYVIISKVGKVVVKDAPRPSDAALKGKIREYLL